MSTGHTVEVNSADNYDYFQYDALARLGDDDRDFVPMTLTASKSLSSDYRHACHGMIFARSQKILWKKIPLRGCVLMQMRFDGLLGFPGGCVDQGEELVTGLNREMEEEIGLDVNEHGFTEDDHIQTVKNEKKKLVLHFFIKEVSENEFCALEKMILSAEEFGIEVFGIVRVPLFTMPDDLRGFSAFLANGFIGNTRSQLLEGLRHSKMLTEEEIKTAVMKCDNYMSQQCRKLMK